MRIKTLTLSLLFVFDVLLSQPKKMVGLNLNYVLSAFVYPNVISSDKGLREISNEVNSWIGFSGDLRVEFVEGYLAGLSLEIVNKKVPDVLIHRISGQTVRIPIEDKYTIYIVELSAFFVAPFSSQKLNICIGGGVGAYKGKFEKSILNARSEIQRSPINIGIHVMSEVQYNFPKNLSLRAQLKFRDPIAEVESRFKNAQIEYNGYIIPIDPTPFRTRVNFDTMTFTLGLVFSF
jgi:hypothetical protein